jgi:GNAT superfamily N-acetyltransferase
MDAGTVQRAVSALADFWRELAERAPAASWVDVDGACCIRTGLPAPAFNGVWGFDRAVDAASVLAAVDGFLGGPLPWNLQLRPGYPAELDDELDRRELVVTEQIPFMVLTDLGRLPDAAGVELREMVSYTDMDAALTLLEQGFGMPVELTRHALPMLMFFLLEAHTWLADAGGGEVSTAMSVVADGVVGIYNVATPAEHRGNGYGSVVTAHALREAWAAGCDLAYLQSSPIGFGVYERLGFVTAERWTQWMPREYVG